MPVHEFMRFMRDVAEALAAAHRSGVIHRDLKPTNIFLHTDRDGRVVPKILDFGVSKILEEENNTALTVVGTVLGSPLYMSPEQAMGAEGIDGRTDVFAFGAHPLRGALGAARVRRAELQRAHRDHRDEAAQAHRRRRAGPAGGAARARPRVPGDRTRRSASRRSIASSSSSTR